MRKIIFLWATVRPDMVKSTWNEWMSKCSDLTNVYLKFAVRTEEQKQQIESFNFNNCEVIIVDDKPGYTHAVTQLTKRLETEDDSILLLLSDDFFPPDKWDLYLLRKFENWDGALFLDDGYQQRVKEGQLCLTLSCLTFSCLKKVNRYVIHPDYYHFFSDNEAFVNLNQLGLLKDDRDIDNTIFEHRHYVFGARKQDENDLNNFKYWDIDNATFDKRMSMSIEERLK
ncbi:MAG: hypothetical protein ACM3O3_12780 [Syntrophothermus sp.]